MGSLAQSSLLQNLPARPPTPPRETSNDINAALAQRPLQQAANPRLSLHTPPNVYSPGSSTCTNASSRRVRKKVGFSAQAEYKEPPVYADAGTAKLQPTPLSIPASNAAHPVKSILKVSTSPNPLDPRTGNEHNDRAAEHANLATMLESTVKQLAGADRDSKLDAYMMLGRALKTSNNLPDRIALQAKMGLFQQFIQRDVAARSPATGGIDSSLVNRALNLLATFLHFPAIASTLSSDFAIFILDHCIRLFEDESTPKDVARHLMQVVALQDFPSRVMTHDRVGRLVTALHKMEEHLTGKSIIMSRVLIYRRLVKQSKLLMAVHSDWLLDLLTDMLSGVKEIRATAIALGLEAAYALGNERQVARRVVEIFQLTAGEKTYVEYYTERLRGMTKDKNDSHYVPQIWSVVFLLLRMPFEKWDFFSTWLHIIQTCFNSSDYQTRHEANFAWNRFVYGVHLNDQQFSRMVTTLSQPLGSQVKRKGSGKPQEELRKVVLGSICNLFYYAFKPNCKASQIDTHWDNSVQPIMESLMSPRKPEEGQDSLTQAGLILTGLFDCSTARLWKESHIVESPTVQPAELPAIDPKWIRRNFPRVFAVVSPILTKTFPDLSDRDSVTYKLWFTLVRSVATAASKEIKVSLETASFVAHSLGVLASIWANGPQATGPRETSAPDFLQGVEGFLTVIIDALGTLPFTEKMLVMNRSNMFVPVSTPSHRPAKHRGIVRSPLYHLFSTLSTQPPGIEDNAQYAKLVKTVFTPFFSGKGDKARLDLAEDLMRSVPQDAACPYGPWILVSENMIDAFANGQASNRSTGSEGLPVGQEYRDVVRILERGLKSTPNLPAAEWTRLFSTVVGRVRDESGEAGLGMMVIEPLAKTSLERFSIFQPPIAMSTDVRLAAELLHIANHPRDGQAVDAARRRLWGTTSAWSRPSSLDVFDNLYSLVNTVLEKTYENSGLGTLEGPILQLITNLTGFLNRCQPQVALKSVIRLEDGMALWIRDAKAQVNGRHLSEISEAVRGLWHSVCEILRDIASTEGLRLDALEGILCAGFESKHRHIVNSVAALWNGIFDKTEEVVDYPAELRATLLSVRPFVDVVLPGLDVSEDEAGAPPPAFVDSQDTHIVDDSFSRPFRQSTSRPTSRQAKSPASVGLLTPTGKQKPTTPKMSVTKPATTPRLRHDDSQLQFAAIDTSPHKMESQVLTERQKEVRDRQKGNAAIFLDIQSSPRENKENLSSSRPGASDRYHAEDEAATPEADGRFDEYVSSTPTPRRGQPVAMAYNEHDLTDTPSSPPEPRRYPLLEAIQARNASVSMLDEWQFSSSPISGSPNPNHTAAAVHQLPGGEERPGLEPAEPGSSPENAEGPEEGTMSVASDIAEKTVSDSPTEEVEPASAKPASSPKIVTTPTRRLRSAAQETPICDKEVFVDALTSPPPPTPTRYNTRQTKSSNTQQTSQAGPDRSFSISDGDERSMLRLVVELDSRQCGPMPRYSESPEKNKKAEVLDCITVKAEPKGGRGRSRKTRSGTGSSSVPSTPVEPIAAAEPTTEEKRSGGKKKRKRPASTAHDSGGKRQKQRTINENDEALDSPASSLAQHHGFNGVDEEQDSSSSLAESTQQSADELASPIMSEGGDNEVQSQIALEQEARAHRDSQQAVPDDNAAMEVDDEVGQRGDGEPIADGESEDKSAEELQPSATGGQRADDAQSIMSVLQTGLEKLRTASLSREEVYKMEDMFMDMKRELFNAERRGRD